TLSVAISADAQIAAAGTDDGAVKLWDIRTAREIFSTQSGSRGTWSVALTKDGHMAASGSDDRSIKLWSIPGASQTSPQQGTIQKLFQVIAELTDRKDIEFLRVTEDYRVMVKLSEAPTGIPLELLSQGLTSLLGWVGYLCQ